MEIDCLLLTASYGIARDERRGAPDSTTGSGALLAVRSVACLPPDMAHDRGAVEACFECLSVEIWPKVTEFLAAPLWFFLSGFAVASLRASSWSAGTGFGLELSFRVPPGAQRADRRKEPLPASPASAPLMLI